MSAETKRWTPTPGARAWEALDEVHVDVVAVGNVWAIIYGPTGTRPKPREWCTALQNLEPPKGGA